MLILNAGQIAHIDPSRVNSPISGYDMTDRETNVSPGGMGIMILDGKFVSISDSESLQSEFVPDWDGYSTSSKIAVIDANGSAIIPGLVDSHTHLIWDGDR